MFTAPLSSLPPAVHHLAVVIPPSDPRAPTPLGVARGGKSSAWEFTSDSPRAERLSSPSFQENVDDCNGDANLDGISLGSKRKSNELAGSPPKRADLRVSTVAALPHMAVLMQMTDFVRSTEGLSTTRRDSERRWSGA